MKLRKTEPQKKNPLFLHMRTHCALPCALCLSFCVMLTLTACGGNSHASNTDGAAADSPASESTADFSASLNAADDPKNAEADGGGKETIIAPGLTEEQPLPFTVTSNHLYQMDETVAVIDIQDGKIVNDALLYTFTKATLYDDFSQAGLDEDALSPYTGAESECLLDDNGNLKKSVKVLLLELTVQNACAEPEQNISSLSVCCVTSINESGDRVEGSLLELFPGEIAYFSQHSGKKSVRTGKSTPIIACRSDKAKI